MARQNVQSVPKWARTDDSIRCPKCMTKRCTNCRQEKARSRYSPDQWQLARTEKQRLCYKRNLRHCFECHSLKGQNEFDRENWNMADQDCARRCVDCQVGTIQRGMWMCRNKQCNKRKPFNEFKFTIQKYGLRGCGGSRHCRLFSMVSGSVVPDL